jgi:hypothetical protein
VQHSKRDRSTQSHQIHSKTELFGHGCQSRIDKISEACRFGEAAYLPPGQIFALFDGVAQCTFDHLVQDKRVATCELPQLLVQCGVGVAQYFGHEPPRIVSIERLYLYSPDGTVRPQIHQIGAHRLAGARREAHRDPLDTQALDDYGERSTIEIVGVVYGEYQAFRSHLCLQRRDGRSEERKIVLRRTGWEEADKRGEWDRASRLGCDDSYGWPGEPLGLSDCLGQESTLADTRRAHEGDS